jgi:hypothetical protein
MCLFLGICPLLAWLWPLLLAAMAEAVSARFNLSELDKMVEVDSASSMAETTDLVVAVLS